MSFNGHFNLLHFKNLKHNNMAENNTLSQEPIHLIESLCDKILDFEINCGFNEEINDTININQINLNSDLEDLQNKLEAQLKTNEQIKKVDNIQQQLCEAVCAAQAFKLITGMALATNGSKILGLKINKNKPHEPFEFDAETLNIPEQLLDIACKED